MEIAIDYVHTAFQHQCTREGIRHAINNWLYDDLWDDATDKHLLIGFDHNGNLLEIMYNVIDEQRIRIFHAMPCRNVYLPLIEARRNNARPDR